MFRLENPEIEEEQRRDKNTKSETSFFSNVCFERPKLWGPLFTRNTTNKWVPPIQQICLGEFGVIPTPQKTTFLGC